jgi:hypothetical protein
VEAKACGCGEALVVLDNEVGCMLVMLVKPYFACRSSLNKAFPTRVPCQKPESTDLNQDFGGQIPCRLRKLSNPSPHPTPKCIDQVHGYYAEPRARSGCFGFGGIIRGKKLYAVFSRAASCFKGPYERVCRADPDTRIKKIYWITKFALRPCLRPVHYWQQPAFLQFTWQAAASSTGIATASNESAPRSSKIFLMEVSFVFQAVQPLPRKLIAVALLSVRVRSSVITRSGEATYRYYPGACEEKLMR